MLYVYIYMYCSNPQSVNAEAGWTRWSKFWRKPLEMRVLKSKLQGIILCERCLIGKSETKPYTIGQSNLVSGKDPAEHVHYMIRK